MGKGISRSYVAAKSIVQEETGLGKVPDGHPFEEEKKKKVVTSLKKQRAKFVHEAAMHGIPKHIIVDDEAEENFGEWQGDEVFGVKLPFHIPKLKFLKMSDPEKAMVIGEYAPDQQAKIGKVNVAIYSDDYSDDIWNLKYKMIHKEHNHVHLILTKREMENYYFYRGMAGGTDHLPYFMQADEWHSVVLQFQLQSKPADRVGVDDKVVDRYMFLSYLREWELTLVDKRRIESGWDVTIPSHITSQEEPLLAEFEARQVLSYYRELDSSPDGKVKQKKKQRSMISLRDLFRIAIGTMLGEASNFKKQILGNTNQMANTAKGQQMIKNKVARMQAKLDAKQIKQGRMVGPKYHVKELLWKMKNKIMNELNPALDEVFYFEWAEMVGVGRHMRRVSPYEFLYAVGAGDLVRPLELLTKVTTASTDKKGWTAEGQDPALRVKMMLKTRDLVAEESVRYQLSHWMRAKCLKAVEVHLNRKNYEVTESMKEAARQKGMAHQAQVAADNRRDRDLNVKRTTKQIVYPGLKEWEARKREEAERNKDRSATNKNRHWVLLDALDGMEGDSDG